MSTFRKKTAVLASILLLAATACAGDVAQEDEHTGSTQQAAVAYNTPPYQQPGDQYDANGNLLGPQTNPFMLITTQKFASVDHANAWAVDPTARYGMFSQPLFLSGIQQYKWLACGTTGAAC